MDYLSSRGSVSFESFGKKENPTIVFTHGVAMDKDAFLPQVAHFQHDYHVVVWDLPGHGASYPLTGGLTYEEAAEALHGLLRHLEVEDVILAGVSLGGQISQYYAHHHPEHVKAVVDIGSLPLHKKPSRLTVFALNAALHMAKIIPARLFYRMFAHDKAVTKKVRAELRRTVEATGKKAVMTHSFAMTEAMKKGIPSPLTGPVLVVHGAKDLGFLRKGGRRWAEAEENAEHVQIEGAGHIVTGDASAAFNDTLADFAANVTDAT